MINVIYILFVGIISGFFVGLLGIGSGIIMIPGLTFAGMTIKQAITTGLMLQAIPQTIPGFLIYHKKGHFRWSESMIALVGSLVGIFLGALMQHYSIISDKQLYTLLSICLVISGGYVYYRNVWNPILEKEIKQSKVDYLQASNNPVSKDSYAIHCLAL